MDEEILFRSIHRHLLERSRAGHEPDTEAGLADRFCVSRHHVRQALDLLSQLGLVTRTQKLGIACNEPEPDDISRHISSLITVGGFDRHELHEARALFDTKLLGLVVRRMHPADLGVLTEIITSMEGCIEFRGAALKFHRSFGETIFKSCGNRVLQVLATSLLYHTMNHLDAHADEQEDSWYTDMLDMDRSVLAALHEEDAERAGALVTDWLAEELAV